MEQKFNSIKNALKETFGEGTEITKKSSVFGGDINDSYKMTLSSGETVFLKTNSVANFDFFTAEAEGLRALSLIKEIGVPAILGKGIDKEMGCSFLLLEYIESSHKTKEFWENFGHQLGGLHKADCRQLETTAQKDIHFGFVNDNYIGRNEQKNDFRMKWSDFYRDCRLLPQIRMAKHYLDSKTLNKLNYILERMEEYVREPEFPSLLHGDLWSGNVLCGEENAAWIFDPAVYIGDFETDLAMTELFGRFPDTFYRAYHEVNPIDSGYRERKIIYHLYHLLNHLNLFGSAYLASVAETVAAL